MNQKKTSGNLQHVLDEQLRRIDSLASFPLEAGEAPLSVATQDRAKALVKALWYYASPELDRVLEAMFITSTGAGDIQIEWEIGNRYLEVEIPATGQFSYLSEVNDAPKEGSLADEKDVVGMVLGFWAPAA